MAGSSTRKPKPGDPFPIEYDFAKAPKLKVPGDWNTQRDSLLFYEGPIWYERDFTYQPKEHTRVFLHVGAANYRSWFWVNGKKVCQHEGGFTAFNCEITAAIHAGDNFVVAAVDNTRLEDGVPGLETDWWNYGGLTRSITLLEVPDTFIDQYDLHLARGEGAWLDGWAHVDGAQPGQTVEIEIPELSAHATATTGAGWPRHIPLRGQESCALVAGNAQALQGHLSAATKIQSMISSAFAPSKHAAPTFCSMASPSFFAVSPFMPRLLIAPAAPTQIRTQRRCSDGRKNWGAISFGLPTIHMMKPCCAQQTAWDCSCGQRILSIGRFTSIIPMFTPKAEHQLEEEIGTSRNHAAIILWSMANETPNTEARTHFIQALAAKARDLDPSRLITAALLVRAQRQHQDSRRSTW